MRRCLDLAARGTGHVAPNPRVGCVVVDAAGEVLGEGWHARYGGPHAEVEAIRAAEARHGPEALRRATLVVSLEPCAHHGKTPPCADLIVEAGIPRVVVGTRDPFPAVDGRGIERLRAAGVDVTVGVLEDACRRLNDAFAHHARTGRPYVALKVAQTLDGFAATHTGDSRWVTGPEARARVHAWRAQFDAVLVGSGTAFADDPALTVRDAEGRQPLRIVLDRAGTLPAWLRLFTDRHAAHTVAVVADDVTPAYEIALTDRGGRLLHLPSPSGPDAHFDVPTLLAALGAHGRADGLPLQSILVEAGPRLAGALLRAPGCVQHLYAFVAPKLVGGDRRALPAAPVAAMADAHGFESAAWEPLGPDVLLSAACTPPDLPWT